MRRALLIIMLMIPAVLLHAQDKTRTYSGNCSDLPFADFAISVEQAAGIRIFFNPAWTADIKVTGKWSNAAPLAVIDPVVAPFGLFCTADDEGNLIITRGYTVKHSFIREEGDTALMAMSDTVRTTTQNGHESEVITLGNPADLSQGGRVLLTGYVTNSATGEPISGASVQIRELGTGVMTNPEGYYLISVPRGSYLVEYRSLGSHDTFRNINIYTGGRVNLAMDERIIPIREAIVTASRREKLDRLESGVAKMNIMTIRLSPSSMGEADIIKSVLLTTGVQSDGEGS
ncbi:MAG: carboxypeptidase-like regulatory domain-containing protein, partial [Bacteroidales bacterium]|nr:carboxypeptidase-like regulatory domain-containing protein [Bacteroidales bacterium]